MVTKFLLLIMSFYCLESQAFFRSKNRTRYSRPMVKIISPYRNIVDTDSIVVAWKPYKKSSSYTYFVRVGNKYYTDYTCNFSYNRCQLKEEILINKTAKNTVLRVTTNYRNRNVGGYGSSDYKYFTHENALMKFDAKLLENKDKDEDGKVKYPLSIKWEPQTYVIGTNKNDYSYKLLYNSEEVDFDYTCDNFECSVEGFVPPKELRRSANKMALKSVYKNEVMDKFSLAKNRVNIVITEPIGPLGPKDVDNPEPFSWVAPHGAYGETTYRVETNIKGYKTYQWVEFSAQELRCSKPGDICTIPSDIIMWDEPGDYTWAVRVNINGTLGPLSLPSEYSLLRHERDAEDLTINLGIPNNGELVLKEYTPVTWSRVREASEYIILVDGKVNMTLDGSTFYCGLNTCSIPRLYYGRGLSTWEHRIQVRAKVPNFEGSGFFYVDSNVNYFVESF